VAEFEVPQAAVEAGLTAWKGAATCMPEQDVRAVLCGAGPHIAAAALRQAAEELWDRMDGERLAAIYHAWLLHRADELDGRQPTPDTREGILAAAGLTEADMAERRTAAWLATLPGPDEAAR
jgi:hypothetical protein